MTTPDFSQMAQTMTSSPSARISEPSETLVQQAMRFLEERGFRRSVAGETDFRKAATVLAKASLTDRRGIIVTGVPGVGKSHFVDVVTRRMRNGKPRVWIALGVTGWEDKCSPEHWRVMYGTDIFDSNLVIDDLGSDYIKCNYGTREDCAGRLIMDYHVYGRGRLFVTTNLSPDNLIADRDNRLLSRLQGMCLGVNFTGPSKRDARVEGMR